MKKIKILIIVPTIFKSKKEKVVYFNENNLKTLLKQAQKNNIEIMTSFFFNSKKILSTDKSELSSLINTGFTGAVNSSLLANYQEDYDWFLILNDDAVLKSDFFEKLRHYLIKKKYDVISCGVEDLSGNPESYGLSYHRSGLAFPITDPNQINNEYFCGTVFLVSRACVHKHINQDGYFFHPLYFAYAEDLEVSLRMKKSGERIYIHPESLVIHEGSQTAKRGSEFQLYQGYRNVLLTIFFHWSLREIIFNLPWLIFGQLYGLGITLKNRRFKVYPRILWYFLKNFQVLLFEREKYHSKPPMQSRQWNTTVAS